VAEEKAREVASKISQWEAEIKSLKVKLRSARALQKIVFYDEIKALQEKISSARSGPASAQTSSGKKA
jgi:hypothetical protein